VRAYDAFPEHGAPLRRREFLGILGGAALTAAGVLAVMLLPLNLVLVVLPLLGITLNGVTTAIYGSVPNYAKPERRTHALSVFYTVTIGSAAPLSRHGRMSALGHKRTFAPQKVMSAFPESRHVRCS
jgi:hypothetical protein